VRKKRLLAILAIGERSRGELASGKWVRVFRSLVMNFLA
jgi:hypothetical protein